MVKPVKLGSNERMTFSKINEVIDMPNLIDEDIEPITFSEYPRNHKYILGLREKINKAIKDKLS